MNISLMLLLLVGNYLSFSKANIFPSLRKGRPRTDKGDDGKVSYRCAQTGQDAAQISGDQCNDASLYCYDSEKGPIGCGDGSRCRLSPSCSYAEVTRSARDSGNEGIPSYKCSTTSDIPADICNQYTECYDADKGSPNDDICAVSGGKCLEAMNCRNGKFEKKSLYPLIDELKEEGFKIEIVDWSPFKCVSSDAVVTDKHCSSHASCYNRDDPVKMDASRCKTHLPCLRTKACIVPDGYLRTVPAGHVRPGWERGVRTYTYIPYKCFDTANDIDTEDTCQELRHCHDDFDPSRPNMNKCGSGFTCRESQACPYKTVFASWQD